MTNDAEGKVEGEVKGESEASARVDAIKRHWALKLAAVLAPAIVSALAAYTGAGETSRTQAAEVKDKAESGYQFVKEALTELRTAVTVLQERETKRDAELADLKKRLRLGLSASRRRADALAAARAPAAAAPPPPLAPAPSAPLPTDLDKAKNLMTLQQQKAPDPAPPPK